MGTTQYSDLDTLGKRRKGGPSELLVSTTGYTDKVICGGTDYKTTLKSISVVVDSQAVGTAGFTVSFGTVASSGAYGTVTVPVTAVVGDRIVGTITNASRPAATAMVIDQTTNGGNGRYKCEFEYEHDPS